MAIIIGLIALLWNIKPSKKGEFYKDNFSVSQTNSLKGVFALFVILHHLCTYLADYYPSFYAYKYLGFLMVGGFFLISGYGLTYGVIHKSGYTNGFLKHRLPAILIPYYIICIFNFMANKISGTLNLRYVVFSLFGITMWYVAVIVGLYLMFYVCFRFFKQKTALMLISIGTVLYILGMFAIHRIFGKYNIYAKTGLPEFGFWWYNSVICFLLGIWYCKLKNKIDAIFQNKYLLYTLIAFTICAITYYFTCLHFNVGYTYILICEIIASIAFTVLILIFTYKFKIKNPILDLFGKLSLELYLCHALFIYAWRSRVTIFGTTIYVENSFLYFVLIMTSSIVFSWVVHKVSTHLLKVFKPKN